jgi:hypothetical protein
MRYLKRSVPTRRTAPLTQLGGAERRQGIPCTDPEDGTVTVCPASVAGPVQVPVESLDERSNRPMTVGSVEALDHGKVLCRRRNHRRNTERVEGSKCPSSYFALSFSILRKLVCLRPALLQHPEGHIANEYALGRCHFDLAGGCASWDRGLDFGAGGDGERCWRTIEGNLRRAG